MEKDERSHRFRPATKHVAFAEAVLAFQHAVNARLPPTHTARDEAKLLGQFDALKTEFWTNRPISDRTLAGKPGITGTRCATAANQARPGRSRQG
jgi:hypothetical protein